MEAEITDKLKNNKTMDEDLVKESEESQEKTLDDVIDKHFPSPEESQEKVDKKIEEVMNKFSQPTKDEVVEKLQTELVDLKDLYDNLVKENTAITKLSREYEAKVLELQSLLDDTKKENASIHHKLEVIILEHEKDVVSQETRIDEMDAQIQNLNLIIEMLIQNR